MVQPEAGHAKVTEEDEAAKVAGTAIRRAEADFNEWRDCDESREDEEGRFEGKEGKVKAPKTGSWGDEAEEKWGEEG